MKSLRKFRVKLYRRTPYHSAFGKYTRFRGSGYKLVGKKMEGSMESVTGFPGGIFQIQ